MSEECKFDPAPVFAEMADYLAAACLEGKKPKHFRVAESLLRDLSQGSARLASYGGVPIVCADEWSWGWMLLIEKDMFAWGEHWFTPRKRSQPQPSTRP